MVRSPEPLCELIYLGAKIIVHSLTALHYAYSYLQKGETPLIVSFGHQGFPDVPSPVGACGLNGEHCTMVETTLVNPTCAGCGSSADITLIEP